MKRKLAAILLATTVGITVLPAPAEAQFFGGSIVFDPKNYAENLLTATRELQQVNNETQELQNEATMLQNMGKNLSSLNGSQLPAMTSALTRIGTLMNEGNGIAFNVNATNTAWTQSYPTSYPIDTPMTTLTAGAQTRWQQAMAAFQQALHIQAQIVQNVEGDSATLTNLVNASQGAQGNLQVSQAANQLQALAIEQQLQTQNLMAAQYRATALEQARNAEAEEEGSVAFQNFIGSSNAYTPQ